MGFPPAAPIRSHQVVRLNLRLKDTIDRVQTDLQLPGPDAAVYVHLCMAGPAKASDLAEALHVHRNDVYRTTERLAQRGLVETTMERPARFVAVAPTEVFDHEIESRLAAVDNLRKSRTEIMSLIEQLRSLAPSPPKGVYKIVQGRTAIYAHRDEMLARAESSIEWVCSYTPTLRHDEVNGAMDALLARAAGGLAIKLLTSPMPGIAAHPRASAPGVQLREFSCETPVRFLIVDGKELLMWVVNDSSESLYAEDDVAIFTTAPGFVGAQHQFMATAWATGCPL